jgi:hypothetical protein
MLSIRHPDEKQTSWPDLIRPSFSRTADHRVKPGDDDKNDLIRPSPSIARSADSG